MSFYVIDVESDGPIPPKYSMVCFGVVKVKIGLSDTFYGTTKPISELWKPDALAISGFSREEHLKFDDPKETMIKFFEWIKKTNVGKPVFMSDNLAYDWKWIDWYFHWYLEDNPFGWSGRRIGDLYCGMKMDVYTQWKHLRETKHSHHPVDDAMGNAEVVLKMQKMGLKMKLV
jgi:hypothetical protein